MSHHASHAAPCRHSLPRRLSRGILILTQGTTGQPVEKIFTIFFLSLYALETFLGLLGCAALYRFSVSLLKLWFLCYLMLLSFNVVQLAVAMTEVEPICRWLIDMPYDKCVLMWKTESGFSAGLALVLGGYFLWILWSIWHRVEDGSLQRDGTVDDRRPMLGDDGNAADHMDCSDADAGDVEMEGVARD